MAARELPSGTVTLLFTDIEGSTRLLQELGREPYVRALTDHRRLLREALTSHGGVEVETQGDSFHFAFPFGRDAVAGAVAVQRALQEHEWESQPIRVRVGMHTGEPTQADGLYAGVDVHHAARVMSAGHGGQILLSHRTAELVREELDSGITLLDLGEHRLKDITATQRLFQVAAAGLPDAFPPLHTIAPPRTNLPLAASPLIGREQELAELTALISGASRVVTITGTGGSGKTRLAIQVASSLTERFPDGVVWVPLAPLTDSGLVLSTIAQALGVKDDLPGHLAPATTLLVLDNFEHVLAASAAVSQLLGAGPNVKALVTSRAPLRIEGECEYVLDPLTESAAVTLFLERSRAAGREVVADETVAEVCRRLDYLPLAIELAAARTRLLTPPAILARLEQRLGLLTEGRRDAPERHQTLHATIEWSYDLLDEGAKPIFDRLSVFAGSFPVEAAEHVTGADLDGLAALANLSLLKHIGDDRLLMLETIREFAQEKADDASDMARVRRRHAEWYLARALETERASRGVEEAERLEQLELDYPNVCAALQSSVDDGDHELTLQLAVSLKRFWFIRRSPQEGLSWLERALAASPAAATRERCQALEAAEDLTRVLQDIPRAGELARERLEHSRQLNDLSGIATSLGVIAIEAQWNNDLTRARELLEEGLSAARDAGDPYATGFLLSELGFVSYSARNLEHAREQFQGAAAIARRVGDDQSVAACTGDAAAVLVELGRYGEAAGEIREALERCRRLRWGHGTATTLALAGVLLARVEDAASAATLFGAAASLTEEHATPVDFGFRELFEQVQESVRETLGEPAFDELTSRGASLSADEAVQAAERMLQAVMPDPSPIS